MKNQIFYLLGAGASVMQDKYTKKVSLPLANNFSDKLYALLNNIVNENNITQTEVSKLLDKIAYQNKDLNFHINEFIKVISTANTIDEAMRYYYLNNETFKFEEYKKMISIFFYLFENIELFRDPRYKQFLMTLIVDKNFTLPENIKILSWNYDNQFEHACCEIQENKKNLKKIINLNDNFFKINGSATFQEIIQNSTKHLDISESQRKFDEFRVLPNKIDFAWEEEFKSKFQTTLSHLKRNRNTDTNRYLVVIGYSFPYINHQFDASILNTINPKKIYIQNTIKYDENYKTKFLERMYNDNSLEKPEIEFINDCDRFYIPNEMYFDYKGIPELGFLF